MIPSKLKNGDEIRVIAPARSMKIINQETRDIANKRLEDLGFKVTFGKNVMNADEVMSSSVEDRIN